jgi:tetratricopeptide (TPR) repeat protein
MRYALPSLVIVAFIAGFACSEVKEEPVPQTALGGPPAAAAPTPPPPAPIGATLLDGLGSYQRPITTAKPEAQRWFDQGLMLSYGFNHDAAERSFLKAVENDPDCAMCWWGAALVLGPHVNATMDPGNNAKAWMRVQKAQALAPRVDLWEQAYIEALAARYAEKPPEDRAPLDRAYANAMNALAKKLPDDLDAATLYAESLMDLSPWNYYDARGRAKGNTGEIVAVLESVMARNPDHPGALHLYIHAVEASAKVARGVAAADRLRELVPGSGHLVHMPAHIYTRVGRYHDAAVANQQAILADNAYLAACRPAPGVYPLGYVPHNHHFLWWAASMEGASTTALAAAEETAKRAYVPDLIKAPGFEFLQDFWVTPLKAKVQFRRWDDVVATPQPPADMPYPVAIWHFAQGMAAASQQRLDAAQSHLAELARAAADPQFEKYLVGPQQPLSRTLKVAERVLAGELALARKDAKGAIAALQQAVAAEDANPYFEPPLWHQPTRHQLGAALMAAGKAVEAEQVYREDLKRNPDNGWALRGLALSLKAQGKKKEALAVEEQQKKAWQHADVQITASAL